MIRIQDFSFRYRGSDREAVSHINLEIGDGEFLGIIGSSGAGKTTLGYGINGVVPRRLPGDFYGEIRVNGLDTLEAGPEHLARDLGSVFQDIESQITASVVEDEILFGLENFAVPREEIEGRMEEALGAVGISDLRNRTIHSLSGGQKQKVVIAAITALRPGILILDEPTGELDPRSSRRVFEDLREMNRTRGTTIIVIEQKIMLLCEFARRLAVMDRGRLLVEGPVEEVLEEGEKLENGGVNIPRVTTLGRTLRDRGLYRGRLPRNLEEARIMMEDVLGA
jgi:energy-coupling factor transport system ATP-binding protein